MATAPKSPGGVQPPCDEGWSSTTSSSFLVGLTRAVYGVAPIETAPRYMCPITPSLYHAAAMCGRVQRLREVARNFLRGKHALRRAPPARWRAARRSIRFPKPCRTDTRGARSKGRSPNTCCAIIDPRNRLRDGANSGASTPTPLMSVERCIRQRSCSWVSQRLLIIVMRRAWLQGQARRQLRVCAAG
jgi:hypothetical protein